MVVMSSSRGDLKREGPKTVARFSAYILFTAPFSATLLRWTTRYFQDVEVTT